MTAFRSAFADPRKAGSIAGLARQPSSRLRANGRAVKRQRRVFTDQNRDDLRRLGLLCEQVNALEDRALRIGAASLESICQRDFSA